ncbi:MAG: branched-chain amino acid ABC transporter permease [Actinomycetia bacterium]|nr:branched-chain amino acid ABC transporter permease [Actinomycetes bacterium]
MRTVVTRVLLVLGLTATLIAGLGGTALSQEAGEEIRGVLESIEGTERTLIAGVGISVSLDGTVVGSAVSNENGEWSVPVPGPGAYQVELDVSTLPEGVGLTLDGGERLPGVSVRAGQSKVVRFQLGSGIDVSTSTLDRFADLVVIGLKFGAIIALASIGLSLIFGVTGLVNFAHGELITLGAVVTFFFSVSPLGPQWHLVFAAIPALLLAALFGWAQEVGLWRPLRRRRTGLLAMLEISIGLSFLLRHVILAAFTGRPRSFADFVIQQEWSLGPIDVVPKNIFIIASAIIVLGGVGLFLQRTKMGTAMRAVSDNIDLAESSGINVEQVILATWIGGTTLAALGGIYFGVSETVQYDMGFRLLLFVFAAVVLGGLGTAYGAMLGGFVIGLATEVSTFWISIEFKNVVALGLLIAILLWRPQGLLGQKERIG